MNPVFCCSFLFRGPLICCLEVQKWWVLSCCWLKQLLIPGIFWWGLGQPASPVWAGVCALALFTLRRFRRLRRHDSPSPKSARQLSLSTSKTRVTTRAATNNYFNHGLIGQLFFSINRIKKKHFIHFRPFNENRLFKVQRCYVSVPPLNSLLLLSLFKCLWVS